MATDYKIVVVPDTGGTRPCIECPQCLGLQLLYVQKAFCVNYVILSHYCNRNHLRNKVLAITGQIIKSLVPFSGSYTIDIKITMQ